MKVLPVKTGPSNLSSHDAIFWHQQVPQQEVSGHLAFTLHLNQPTLLYVEPFILQLTEEGDGLRGLGGGTQRETEVS